MTLTRLPFSLALAGLVLATAGLFAGVFGLFDGDALYRAISTGIFVVGIALLVAVAAWAVRGLMKGDDRTGAIAVLLVATIPLLLLAVLFLPAL